MLNLICEIIGGKVRIEKKNKFVIWVVDSRKSILNIIQVFNDYPPLTTRLRAQINFIKECLKREDIEWYLKFRNFKYYSYSYPILKTYQDIAYKERLSKIAGKQPGKFYLDKNKYLPAFVSNPLMGGKEAICLLQPKVNLVEGDIKGNYFNEWLSGFIEAEGCFSVRQNNNHSFSIGQMEDKYLIEKIRNHFNIHSRVRNPYKNFYFLETYRISTLQRVIYHCNNYPLLGEKLVSFNKFKVLFK